MPGSASNKAPKKATVTALRSTLRKTAPAKLVGKGGFCGFARMHEGGRLGRKLTGLTKRLAERIHSAGSLPSIARRASSSRPRGAWRGKATPLALIRTGVLAVTP